MSVQNPFDEIYAVHVMVLGIGCTLYSDEGFGVRVIEKMQREYDFSEDVLLVDGGVLGINLLGVISKPDHLIVVDAIRNRGKPGDLYRLEGDAIPERIRAKNSLHQVDFLEALTLCQALDHVPETVIVGVEPDATRSFQGPFADGFRHTHLGMKGPPVGAEVDQLRRIVLAPRGHEIEAQTDDEILFINPEIGGIESRCARQQHIETEPRIGESPRVAGAKLTFEEPVPVPVRPRHESLELGRLAKQAQGPDVAPEGQVDLRIDVLDGERRIHEDVAAGVAVGQCDEVHAHRRRRKGPGLEILRPGASSGDEAHEQGDGGVSMAKAVRHGGIPVRDG